MFREQLNDETLCLMKEYKQRFGCDVPTMYLPVTNEIELQAMIRHAMRAQRPLPVRYE
jgi:hypothetical protein